MTIFRFQDVASPLRRASDCNPVTVAHLALLASPEALSINNQIVCPTKHHALKSNDASRCCC